MAPPGVTRKTLLLALKSPTQRLPSGPAVMSSVKLPAVGTEYSVMTPAGVILPILLAAFSVNQMLPSGPLVIPPGLLLAVGIENSVNVPSSVILPILFALLVNHRLEPGPETMSVAAPLVGSGYIVNVPVRVSLPSQLPMPLASVNHRLRSGPVVMLYAWAWFPGPEIGIGYSVTAPDGVILPTLLLVCSMNQTLPSE